MACGTYVHIMAQASDGLEPRFLHPSSSSSTIDWLAPRISFSIPHETMKEVSEISESPARLSSSKSSPSEFEFSMSIHGHDSSYEDTMLAADELFYDGKLLPLYSTPRDVPMERNMEAQRRSNAGHILYGNSEHVTKMAIQKIDHNPISPKAPTCTSRWKELLGLKKVHIQDAKDLSTSSGKQHKKSTGVTPGRRSLDSIKDSKASLSPHGDGHLHQIIKNARHSVSHSESHSHHGGHVIQAQKHVNQVQCDPLLAIADPGLCPRAADRQAWQMESSQLSSKCSDDCQATTSKANEMTSMVIHGHSVSRAHSPKKQREEDRLISSGIMSPRRGAGRGGGPQRGVSPGRSSAGSRAMESSRSAIATRLVVRGLDRSYSSPKPVKKRPEQLRSSGRQRSIMDGSRCLERSPSYSAGVRVTPVINVPMYITPGLTKGSKNGIFGLAHFFSSSRKDKASNKLSSTSPAVDHHLPHYHHHHHHAHNADH